MRSQCLFCPWVGSWLTAYRHAFADCPFWEGGRAAVRGQAEEAWVRDLPYPAALWAVLRAEPGMPRFRAAVSFGAQVDAEAARRHREIAARPVPAG